VLKADQDDTAHEQRRAKQPYGADFVNRHAENAEMIEYDRPQHLACDQQREKCRGSELRARDRDGAE